MVLVSCMANSDNAMPRAAESQSTFPSANLMEHPMTADSSCPPIHALARRGRHVYQHSA